MWCAKIWNEIQSPWATFSCDLSCKSFGECLYQLCLSRDWDCCSVYFVKKLKLSPIEWRVSVNRNFQIMLEIFSWMKVCTFTWIWSFDLNLSTVALVVCFGSLSSFKASLRSSLVFCKRFFFSRCPSVWLHPSSHHLRPASMCLLGKKNKKKHPRSTMLPPPCFTVGIMCSAWCAVLVFHHTRCFAFIPEVTFWSLLSGAASSSCLQFAKGHVGDTANMTSCSFVFVWFVECMTDCPMDRLSSYQTCQFSWMAMSS